MKKFTYFHSFSCIILVTGAYIILGKEIERGNEKMKIFAKAIDSDGVQVITIDEQGHVYVDIMDLEEYREVYKCYAHKSLQM